MNKRKKYSTVKAEDYYFAPSTGENTVEALEEIRNLYNPSNYFLFLAQEFQ